MKNRKVFYSIILLLFISGWLFMACSPIREFRTWKNYEGNNDFKYEKPIVDPTKKTIIIIADNKGTEVFDLMAPFYLFNATGKANVYVVAEKLYPIIIRKGFFILPQFSFAEFDALKIQPELIVIPNLSAMDAEHQNPIIVDWIKKQYSKEVNVLSVCDGSITAAATGIYDGKPITTHASDYERLEKEFTKPLWVNNVRVTKSENLFSTGGVSNAVEGALTVINEMFGEEVMMKIQENINYPHLLPKKEHQSIAINFKNKLTIVNKVILKKNNKIGVLLEEGVNEFELAAVMDSYHRTFPSSIESFVSENKIVTSKYGLTIIPTGNINSIELDELHILDSSLFSKEDEIQFQKIEIIKYDNVQKKYIINYCLDRIGVQYGKKFQNITKLLLDYN